MAKNHNKDVITKGEVAPAVGMTVGFCYLETISRETALDVGIGVLRLNKMHPRQPRMPPLLKRRNR